jgi:hypothetical protein
MDRKRSSAERHRALIRTRCGMRHDPAEARRIAAEAIRAEAGVDEAGSRRRGQKARNSRSGSASPRRSSVRHLGLPDSSLLGKRHCVTR